jgi:guanylate kinase
MNIQQIKDNEYLRYNHITNSRYYYGIHTSEEIMSKIGNWVLEMTEAAAELTREKFIKKYGEANADVWDNNKKEELEHELIPSIHDVQHELNKKENK